MLWKWIGVLAVVMLGNVSAAETPDVFKNLAAGKKETVVAAEPVRF